MQASRVPGVPVAAPAAAPISQQQLEALVDLITGTQRVVVVTGAGCSTESNIPDYRGPRGAYTTGVSQVLTMKQYVAVAQQLCVCVGVGGGWGGGALEQRVGAQAAGGGGGGSPGAPPRLCRPVLYAGFSTRLASEANVTLCSCIVKSLSEQGGDGHTAMC
jgi:hypothetical protein